MSGPPDNKGEAITSEGLVALKAEIKELEGPVRDAMAERIKAARELGDLKENADYHIAKDDQAHLETKIKRLNQRLDMAVEIEPEAVGGSDVFSFGTTAEVIDEAAGKTHIWTLVGSTEANLAEGRLSAESPVGQALRDCPVAKTVVIQTPKGPKKFTVTKLV